jgi:hypothetical protein
MPPMATQLPMLIHWRTPSGESVMTIFAVREQSAGATHLIVKLFPAEDHFADVEGRAW